MLAIWPCCDLGHLCATSSDAVVVVVVVVVVIVVVVVVVVVMIQKDRGWDYLECAVVVMIDCINNLPLS